MQNRSLARGTDRTSAKPRQGMALGRVGLLPAYGACANVGTNVARPVVMGPSTRV
jgi:hypothetical protein